MSSEGQTIREALDTLLLLLVDEHRTSDEHEVEIREEYAPAFEALAALEARLAELTGCNQFLSTEQVRADIAEARLAEAERALREIASVPCQIACESLAGLSLCQGCIARKALATQETGK